MVESASKACGSVRIAGKNPKSVWWNDQVKAAVQRKEDAWKEVLEARDEYARERCLGVYREKKRKVKRFISQSKKEVHEQWKEDESKCKWK